MTGMSEGVETMHGAPARGDEIVRSARIDEGADDGRNDRRTRLVWAAGFIDGEGSIGVNSNRAGRASKSLAERHSFREALMEAHAFTWG